LNILTSAWKEYTCFIGIVKINFSRERTTDKIMKPILHLNLKDTPKEPWYSMVEARIKKEEYRGIKPFWNRIFSSNIKIKGKYYHPTDVIICFSNGFSKTRRQMKFECLGLKISEGRKEWGAIPGEQYHTLTLGDIIK
jgi:hypothetical protein